MLADLVYSCCKRYRFLIISHHNIFCLYPTDLQASQTVEYYSLSDKAMDYRVLLMDEDQDRMYVGCKDHVLSMDINNITHGTLKVRSS